MAINTKDESELDTQSSFRVEAELKRAVIDFANAYGANESWGWRMLALRGLGDGAPDKLRAKFARIMS